MQLKSLSRTLFMLSLLTVFFALGLTSSVLASFPNQWCVVVLNIDASGETYVVRQQCFRFEAQSNTYFNDAQNDGYRKVAKFWQLDTGDDAQGHIRFMGPQTKPCSAGYVYKVPDLSTVPYLSSPHTYDNNIERVLGDVTTMGCSEVKLWDGPNYTNLNLLTYIDTTTGTTQCWDISLKHAPCDIWDLTTSMKIRAH